MNRVSRAWLAAPAAPLMLLAVAGFRAPLVQDSREDFTAEVTKGDLPIQVELSGVFVAEDKDEIAMEPESYRGDLIITELLPEGRDVKTGDILMEFDQSSLERSLEEKRNELTDAEVEETKAQAALDESEIDSEGTLSQSEKELSMAQKAFSAAEGQAEFELEEKEKSILDAENSVKDAEVDFQQLIELYKERELHTKTETILIEREQRRVDDSKRRLDKTRREVAHWKEYEYDKDVETKALDVAKKETELKKARVRLEAERKEKQAQLAKAQRVQQKAEREVNELVADSEGLRVIAPRDGILFYGTIGGDSPSDMMIIGMGTNEKEMRIGGRVRTHQVLLTVASMDSLSVQMSVLENDIQHMKAGLPITVLPDAFPALKIEGKLTQVDQVAARRGFFSDLREFTVRGSYDGVFRQLRSGMNCRVTVHADTVPDAVQVPVVAVFSEGGDHYCLVKSGAKTTRRPVEIGATNGADVEITEGLRPGEVVALYDPKDD